MDQAEGLVVDPLEIVNGDEERTVRRKRPVRRLEDPEGSASRLLAAPEDERFEDRAVDRHRRQLSDHLPNRGQRDAPVGLEADDADESGGSWLGHDLRQQACLPAPRLARDQCRRRSSILARLPDERSHLRELPPTADERRAHAAKRTCPQPAFKDPAPGSCVAQQSGADHRPMAGGQPDAPSRRHPRALRPRRLWHVAFDDDRLLDRADRRIDSNAGALGRSSRDPAGTDRTELNSRPPGDRRADHVGATA
ncbi:MAG: hypothetical protein A2V84_09730 [Chloroflexi bacterium RBG_16_70_13]|nr:MAG: hypothetical protein A2V84_09730 [Chloroflexi bacterium RBG_16_70_13]